ncbi:MAG: hypothetical protein AAGA89_11395 [Pseudomonadota bacterium]
MSVKDRSPTTRLMVLAAFVLAAGLFALRAYDVLGSGKTEPVGGVLEQELTYLLEPITGPDKVRVSVTGSSPKSVLVMIDGDFATDLRPLRTRIETVLTAAMAFNPERDTLSLTKFPFARGVGASLTPLQIAELTGLALLSALLLALGLAPQRLRQTVPREMDPPLRTVAPKPPARLAAPAQVDRHDQHDANALAEAKPNETAQVVRNWMSYAED